VTEFGRVAAGTKGCAIKVSSGGGSGRHFHWHLGAGGNRQEQFRLEASLKQENITIRISKKMKEDHMLKNNLEISVFLYRQQPRSWQLGVGTCLFNGYEATNTRLTGKHCIGRRDI